MTARRTIPRVFTIAPGEDFPARVTRAVLDGRLLDIDFGAHPERLAAVTIYVPTRRICPVFEMAFAEALAPRPAILPRIRPLAEPGDPLDQLNAGEAMGMAPDGERRMISSVERQFMLKPLVDAWRRRIREATGADSAPGIGESLRLADHLGQLIDEMRIAELDLASLGDAAPRDFDPTRFDAYWAASRDFLTIAARHWPALLEEIGAADAWDMRIRAISAEARRLEESGGDAPVIVAGSTGSIPATARLMRAVARLPNGAVVLPGLDRMIDKQGWGEIGAHDVSLATGYAHAQSSLKHTIAEIGIARDDVPDLVDPDPRSLARARLLSEALRPAESVGQWRKALQTIDRDLALEGMTCIEAGDEREEALAIAITMREVLDSPNARVALVTADRALARRVCRELTRWSIAVDDSASTAIGETTPAMLIRLFLAAAHGTAIDILALARHPCFRLGFDHDVIGDIVDAFEILVLRGRSTSQDKSLSERTRDALRPERRRDHPAALRISEKVTGQVHEFAAALDAAFAPFRVTSQQPLNELTQRLADLVRVLTCDSHGVSAFPGDDAAEQAMQLIAEIGTHGKGTKIEPCDMAGIVEHFFRSSAEHPQDGGARAMILGPLEARLIAVDTLILGGLNEGSFPPRADDDPFLNRAMRIDLGLQPPERRIGQSAHDFLMLAGHCRIVLTRSKRVANALSIPSRFLRRFEAFLGKAHWRGLVLHGDRMLKLARQLDRAGSYSPATRPAPIPAAPRVPAKLNVTEIETLRRDPYAIYAKRLLDLVPLEDIDAPLDQRDRGTALHRALELYSRSDPPRDADAAQQALREIGAQCFAQFRGEPELSEFWRRRFEAIVPTFVAFDRARRDGGHRPLVETRGRDHVALATGELVEITGKADRMEIDRDGGLHLIDFKSGAPPSNRQIVKGNAPQLPITAAMALRGAFGALPPVSEIAELSHVPIGGREPVAPVPVKPGGQSLAQFSLKEWDRLVADLEAYARGDTPYASELRPRSDRAGEYDHLARVMEWQIVAPTDESSTDEEDA